MRLDLAQLMFRGNKATLTPESRKALLRGQRGVDRNGHSAEQQDSEVSGGAAPDGSR